LPFLVSEVPSLSGWESLLRLLLAGGLGAAVGFEREVRDRLQYELQEEHDDRRVLYLQLRRVDEQLLGRLSDLDDVMRVRWRR
jgi:hypothetical protein